MWNNFVFSFFRADVGVEQESTLSLILFYFYLLWMMVFLFYRKNLFKNQMLFFSVATILFLLSLTNSDLWLNIESQKPFISLDQLETLDPFRKSYSITKGYLEISWLHFWQENFFLIIHPLLLQQGSFNNQGYENVG